MATKEKLYRIRREWTVVMESYIDVYADSVEAACEQAIADDDYDDQRIADDSDGPTYIGRIECNGRELPVPVNFNGDGMRWSAPVFRNPQPPTGGTRRCHDI